MDIFKYESKLVMAKLKHKLVELAKEDDGDLTKSIYYPHEYAAEVLKMIAEIESDYVLGYWLDEDEDEDEEDLPIRTMPAEELGLPGGDKEAADDQKPLGDTGEVDI